MEAGLNELRNNINKIDEQLIELLAKRRDLSREVVQFKEETNSPIRDKERESELLNRLIKLGKEKGLNNYFIQKIFHEIIEDSVRLQHKYLQHMVDQEKEQNALRISIQGIMGSYSSLAAQMFFSETGKQIAFVSKTMFEEVVKSAETGEADYAMLPIENTTSGGINEVYDLLMRTTLSIVGEQKFHVKHCLVSVEDVPINQITTIYAHYQAVAQCSKFLQTLPNVKIEYFADTALSVQKITEEGRKDFAAIASEEAANIFNVKILRRNIANQEDNFTRFLIGSRNPITVDQRIPCKTSLVMATTHKAGSLVEALMVFQKHNVNLTKLESRPILGNPWEEMFYIDFEGNIVETRIQEVLDELGKYTRFMKVLGSYPSDDVKRTELELIELENSVEDVPTFVAEQKEKEKKKSGKSKSYRLASREYKSEDTIIRVKNVEIGGNGFVVMAGPCSVENKDMVFQCAMEVKNTGGHILRGGCFKPRTSPYSFQGLGYEGLDYLVEAGKEFELPIITEVLAEDQVMEVAKYSDMLQVGARNMQNFSLLKEVGKTQRPVLLKRGMMSSIEELLNAAEYILAMGNRQVILCERGIRTFETATRNTLDLSAIPVLKELTHLPIIVDPSHAVGVRDMVAPMAKAAKIIGAHGIMVEFHPEPEKALSDGPQALYFDQFDTLMKDLKKITV